MIGSLLFFALAGTQQGCEAHAAQGRQPHPQAGVAGVSGGNGGGGGLCGSGQLGHGLGPQHLAAHGAGVGLDALTLRGGGRGDGVVILPSPSVCWAFTVKVTVTVLPKRSVAVRVWTPSAAETVSLPSTSSTGWPLRVTLFRLGSVTVISAVRQ